MKKDNLGDRMKNYENVSRNYLIRRMPVIIRLDGKNFHRFTRGFQKPFDMILMKTMWETAKYLCKNIQGCKIAYTQSDEITLLLTDYDKIDTCAWFDNNIQKMASISASMATLAFNEYFHDNVNNRRNYTSKTYYKYNSIYISRINTALFDSRVFNIPQEEVCNCFIWRQQDATRNSIQMAGRTYFSHKELNKLSCNEIQDKLFKEKDINWNNLPTYQKRGACIIKEQYTLDSTERTIRTRWAINENIPIFTQDRNYIEKYL